jgi:GrpB-like predicted nucleotidyltransferase (UPF0157 family)
MEDGVAEPELEEHLRQVLVRGLQPVRVELVEPNPAWPARYERYAATLRDVLGGRRRLLEHIGSTSVPGLEAKPVIDIVAGLDDPDDEPAYLPDLEAAGWDLRVREPATAVCAAATLNCRPTCIATDPTTPRSTATFVSGSGFAAKTLTGSTTPMPNGLSPAESGRT